MSTPTDADAPTSSLRISMTLSGGASLGAYQAGAAAGLLTAVRHLTHEESVETTVDAIGGASAGSLVALCAAHSLLEGIDPVRLLHEAWVEGVSLELLRGRGGRAPLSFERLRDRVPALLEPRDESGGPTERGPRQEHPIAVHVGLTGLQGLNYPIRGLRRDRPVTGTTYADWGRFQLEPGGGLEQITKPEGEAPLDFVLASAAHPGGFAPRVLDRRRDEKGYESRGIENFPESGKLWYADGGLMQSQPLGRVLAAARHLEGGGGDARRIHLLIDPRSEDPAGSGQWSDPDFDPSWQIGLARSLAILPAQVLYEDLRRIEKDNSRILWADQLIEALAPHLGEGAAEALREVIGRIDEDREGLRADEPELEDARERSGDGDGTGEGEDARLLRRAVDEIAGLAGERPVEVDVISPLLVLDEPGGSVTSLLAGELMGDFGGFLSRELRASDFGLGYESALAWLPDGLDRCGVDADAAKRTVGAVEGCRLYGWEDVKRGDAGVGDLTWEARLQIVRQGLQTARVLASGAGDVRALRERLGNPLERVRGMITGRSGRGGAAGQDGR